MKKSLAQYLFFCLIILFIYRVGTDTKTYMDIEMGSGGESGGTDGADHNKK